MCPLFLCEGVLQLLLLFKFAIKDKRKTWQNSPEAFVVSVAVGIAAV